jgi:hypothetical protein
MTEGRSPLTPRKAIFIVAVSALIVGAIVLASQLLDKPSDRRTSVRGVFPLADGTLLFVEREGFSDSTYDRGRLRVIGRDGRELRRSAPVEMAFAVHGLAGDHVWLRSHGGGLEAWSLASLAPRPGARAAIEAHPMLARKLAVEGLSGDAIVARAADDALYTIAPASYAITKQPKGFEFTRVWSPGGGTNDAFPINDTGVLPEAGGQKVVLDDTELVRPAPIVGPGNARLAVDRGLLVHSVDFLGASNSGIVSRVDAPATVRWSLSMRTVIGPNDLGKDAGYRLAFAELKEGALWIVAEGNVWYTARPDADNSRGHGEYVIRLAEVDPANGAVRAVHTIVKPAK